MLTKWQLFYQKLVSINIPQAGFILFLVHSMVVGFNIASAIATFAICSLYGFRMLLDRQKMIETNKETHKEIFQRIANVESSVSVIKLGQGFRNSSNEEKAKKLF